MKGDVTIVGLGLVGGSLAKALTRAGYRVHGVDRAAVLRAALRCGAIVSGTADPNEIGPTPIIVLAAPPQANLNVLRRLSRRERPETVITDLGSVKVPICALARRRGLASFVGGHPMAGSERSGFGASSADLFAGHPWILTPDGSAPRAVAAVRRLIKTVGARPHTMRPQEHDRTVAFLSHMPQLVAWALERAASADLVARRHLDLAGPGFRDMTRLARSPRDLWRQIVTQNDGEVERAMKALQKALRRRP